MKKGIGLLIVGLVCIGSFQLGLLSQPDVGMGIYFEEGRLVIDGGRHDGYVFNGNTVDITLPAWIEEKMCPDHVWENSITRNFRFDFTGINDPNVIELPNEPNRTILVDRIIGKEFIKKKNNKHLQQKDLAKRWLVLKKKS